MSNQHSTDGKLTNEQFNGHDDRNNNHMEKNIHVIPVIEAGKSQSTDDQSSSTSNLFNDISSNHTDKNGNKEELPTTFDQPINSHLTMKKRVTPVPSSYARRRPYLKTDSSDPKLILSNGKNTTIPMKKPGKSTPIFIPPKKTSPQPHSFSLLTFDESSHHKSKPLLERQTAIGDGDQTTSMTNWTPAPRSTRFYIQSSSSSVEDNSSDESDHESLLIREKTPRIQQVQVHVHVQSPLTILITDPDGNSSTFDLNNDIRSTSDPNEQNTDEHSDSSDGNTLSPNSTFDISSPPDSSLIPGTQPVVLEKHTLHSIGEEEEEEEEEEQDEDDEEAAAEADNDDDQDESNNPNIDTNRIQPGQSNRRWSDGNTEQAPVPSNSSSTASLTKISTVEPVTKSNENAPVKLSKTKYLLMKLHLSSSSKDDESVVSESKKRTVRRAFDKKRYQTQ